MEGQVTVKIFIGCSANGEDAEAQGMLEYSIRSRTTADVEITWMKLSRDPASPWYSNPATREGWNTVGWATPFSPFRWAIPHVCNFEGRGIYMDVDQLVRADIAELANQDIPTGKIMLAKNPQTHCVILWDCAAAKAHLPSFEELRRVEGRYRTVRKTIGPYTATFKGNWNCLDGERYPRLDHPDIKLIHFTAVPTQPHLKWAIPRLKAEGRSHWNNCKAQPHPHRGVAALAEKEWADAKAAGYGVERYLGGEMFGQYDAVRGGPRVSKAA
jgi:hypothetical protein